MSLTFEQIYEKFQFSVWLTLKCEEQGLIKKYIPGELTLKLIEDKDHDAMRSLLYGILILYGDLNDDN